MTKKREAPIYLIGPFEPMDEYTLEVGTSVIPISHTATLSSEVISNLLKCSTSSRTQPVQHKAGI